MAFKQNFITKINLIEWFLAYADDMWDKNSFF